MKRYSIKRLYREARFPDEKFWDPKTGDPIHAGPKGPPPGTRGTAHSDYGARDHDDAVPAAADPTPSADQGDEEFSSTCPGCGYHGSGTYPEECPDCTPAAGADMTRDDVIDAAKKQGLDVKRMGAWVKITGKNGQAIYIPVTKSGSVKGTQSTLTPGGQLIPTKKANGKIQSDIADDGTWNDIHDLLGEL